MRQITPGNNHGSIWIRFTYQSQLYSLSGLGSYKDSAALTRAKAIAHQIYLDCLNGKFAGDPKVYLGEQVKVPIKRRKKLTFLQVWDLWVKSLDLEPHTEASHYMTVRVWLHDAPNSIDSLLSKFVLTRETLAAATWNKRRSMLKSCYEWAISEGYFDAPNPFSQLRASNKKSNYKVNPFTKNEVKMILDEIKNCCPHYLPFITFLFSTGCRTGEAVGLKWKYVDFNNHTITITESNSKRGGRRVQKGTKTESTVVLPMNDALNDLLCDLVDRNNSNFVFTSPTGRFINPDNFRERIWKPVLEKLGLEYRPLYQTRHTVLSQIANDQGLLAAAAAAGHRDATMVTKHYARFQGEIKLPELI